MVNASGMNCAEAYSSWADLRDVLFSLVSMGHGHRCLLKSNILVAPSREKEELGSGQMTQEIERKPRGER